MFDEQDDRWADVRRELRTLLDEAEWKQASRSTLNAHYTDPQVVMAMWDAARGLGFESGRVLEPGCGSGNFIAYAPESAAMVGVEWDRTTAAVTSALYPDAEIHAVPFQEYDTHVPFDLAVGNVPFAKVVPTDARHNRGGLTLHNYFLSKSLELVRPGGVLLALTSRYTLDARNPTARRQLGLHGDLIGALRLPNGAMRGIAGTDAILDLLVLRRRAPGAGPGGMAGWDQTVEGDVLDETTDSMSTVRMNRYLLENRERILGNAVLGRSMYRSGDLMVRGQLNDLGSQVAQGLAAIIDSTDIRYEPAPPARVASARPSRKVGNVELRGDRRLPLRQGSFAVSTTGVIYRSLHGDLVPTEVPKRAGDEVRALVELRDSAVSLLRLEADDAPGSDIEAVRRGLSERYDRYARRWGPLNRASWQRTGRVDPATGEDQLRRVPARLGGFREDPEWPTLAAVEVYDDESGTARAAAIQRQRTIHPAEPRLGADTADDAMAIALDETGRVDVDRIAELLGVEPDLARAELEPLVFEEPGSRELVPAETYLSGNVRQKLNTATVAAQQDTRFARNVEALVGVQPAQITPGDIVVRPGVPWVNARDVAAFAGEVLGARGPKVTYTGSIGRWSIDASGTGGLANDWNTARMSADELLEACCNQRLVRIFDYVDERRVLNVEATTAAREKQELITERFSRWVWEDPTRAARLTERYNELFNSYVAPDYDGDHLSFPGLTATFVPHGHQRAAVARILREGRALLGHGVGAGKTATMVIAGMELRRLGLVDRPAYVVPNHMLEQFSRELLQLYPQARVLVASKNLTGSAGRKEFVARAATGDWDAVVITHSAFERLPLRQETWQKYIDEHTADLRNDLDNARNAPTEDGRKPDTRHVKRLELALQRHEERLKKLLDAAGKDDGVSFEETGIDFLFVDELHLFKNKTIVTAVEGISAQGSKRASDLDAKLWHLQGEHGTRSLVGATATPIANSISEAWVMQTYLQPDVLAEVGLDKFDAWAATFAQQVAAVELSPDGGRYRVTSRLARYQNVPELIGQFRRTADVKTREDLDLKLPQLKGGSAEVVVVPAPAGLKLYVKKLVERADIVRSGGVEPTEDNMLKITSDGRHAALDLRLVGLGSDPMGGKLAAAAERIARIHRETRDLTFHDASGELSPTNGALQIVFCDLATPGKGDGGWNAYDELKQRLVARGVKPTEIAFIHDPRNEQALAQLFARCRNGQVAVLVGSTAKMGVGSNIQARAAALHHIDCPWRPADIEQREGRIIRQGNQNAEVQIFRYATEASFDVYMWQTVERKGGFISQVMRGDAIGRDIDDVGDAVLSYSEVKALASGNPLVIEQAGVQADMAKYERLERAHLDEQWTLRRTVKQLHIDVARERKHAAALTEAINRRIDTSGDRFSMKIAGTRHSRRADASTALKAELSTMLTELEATPDDKGQVPARTVATLAGFDIGLDAWRLNDHRELDLTIQLGDGVDGHVRLEPRHVEDPAVNVIARLEKGIRRLDEEHAGALERASKFESQAEAIDARIGQSFPYEERLASLRSRYQEILDELTAQAEAAAAAKAAEAARSRQPVAAESPDITIRLDGLKTPPEQDPPPMEPPGL